MWDIDLTLFIYTWFSWHCSLEFSVRVLIDAVGSQVSPIMSLSWKSTMTTIINFNLLILPSYWIFDLYTSIYGVTGCPFYGSYIIKVWLLITCFISYKIAFNQSFLTYAGNLVTSAKFMSSGMKCNISDPDYPKVGNAFFISFKTSLKALSKPLTALFAESSATFQ